MSQDYFVNFLASVPLRDLLFASALVVFSLTLMVVYRLRIISESLFSLTRLFFQLLIVGGFLLIVFRINDLWLNTGLCLVMIFVASLTASGRSPHRGSLAVSFIGQTAAALVTLVPMTVLGVIELRASFFLPIAAMVIRNTLDRASLAFERLHTEFQSNQDLIEQYLSLGIDPATASREIVRSSIEASMIPTLNKIKVVGLVGLPGLMTGLILGAEKSELTSTIAKAVTLQTIVFFMIFAGSILSSIIVCSLMRTKYFDENHALQIES